MISLWALLIAGSVIATAACGKRGPPLPPLRPVPGPVTELSFTRRGTDIMIRFRTPSSNIDGSQPLVFDRVEVYALTIGAGGIPPNAVQLMQRANLLTVVGRVDSADATASADAASTTSSGRIVTFTDKGIVAAPPVAPAVAPVPPAGVTPSAPTGVTPPVATGAAVRYYLIQSFANSRRAGGGQSAGVLLADPPPRPEGVALAYDEQTLTLSWTLVPGDSYVVYQSGPNVAADAPAVTPAPLTVATLTQPLVFGKRVCFVVRAVAGTAPVSIESPPSAEVCETPADTFPPPAPTGLVALASPGAISLTWDPVTAADLGGYIVLRGEGSSDRLQPLMTQPVNGTSFNDATAKAGVRYFYAVVAVDKATPANRSKNSNVVDETGR